MKDLLSRLCVRVLGIAPVAVQEIPACGSYRRYMRLFMPDGRSLMGTWNADKKENAAFVSFAESFCKAGLAVPRIYAVDEENDVYIQEDLGADNLFAYVGRDWLPLLEKDANAAFPAHLNAYYRQALRELARLQVFGRDGIDYTKSTPCSSFHRDAIHWDLNYFKYMFLKLCRVPFDEQALEDDFRTFSEYLLQVSCDYFLYRDFQSANIMIHQDKVYFIDFQGGRRGALQYDVASLLYDAKTRLPKSLRHELADYYLQELSSLISVDKTSFKSYYQAYTLCRLMQALGAFGFRGLIEKKPGFTESIPPALAMIQEILDEWAIPVAIPELQEVFHRMQAISLS